ncbi:MAG TPA: hypothetical protein VGB55_00755 [Tepidisphaeraceae bacterium]|jgi:uncharacterized membrane protein
MPSALRRLGVFLFCIGVIAVVVGLLPIAGAWIDKKQEQAWLAAAIMGGLLVVSGLVMDWLGTQAIREAEAEPVAKDEAKNFRPPGLKLSSKPAGAKGYREDLMA